MNKKSEKENSVTPIGRFFVKVLGGPKRQSWTIPVFAILLSLIAGSVVLLLVGKNPLEAFLSLLQGAGVLPKGSYAAKKGMITDFMSMVNLLTPMIFAALAVAVAFKTGLFNIGVSGQMLLAGFVASITVGYSNLPSYIAMPLVLLITVVMGALVGGLIGWLKYKFNINEVVTSIMLNYIISYVISYFINTYFVNPVSRQSQPISAAARLTLTSVEIGGLKLDIPLGILLAIPVAFLVKFLLDRTKTGYELKVVGLNRKAAKYAGISVGKNVVLAMVISGALAGLAGATYYLGYYNSIQPKVLADMGFDSIAVSLLGNSNPIGILFSSLLITVINKGSNYMSSIVDVQQEISQVITGLILLFSACGAFIRYRVQKTADNIEEAQLKSEVKEEDKQ